MNTVYGIQIIKFISMINDRVRDEFARLWPTSNQTNVPTIVLR